MSQLARTVFSSSSVRKRWVNGSAVLGIALGTGAVMAGECPAGQSAMMVKVESGLEEKCGKLPTINMATKSQPTYPEGARSGGVEGRVVLGGLIDKAGTVRDLEVIDEKPGCAGFGESAIEAVRNWRYQPATVDSVPVDVVVTLMIDFDLPEVKPEYHLGLAKEVARHLEEHLSGPERSKVLVLRIGPASSTIRVARTKRGLHLTMHFCSGRPEQEKEKVTRVLQDSQKPVAEIRSDGRCKTGIAFHAYGSMEEAAEQLEKILTDAYGADMFQYHVESE